MADIAEIGISLYHVASGKTIHCPRSCKKLVEMDNHTPQTIPMHALAREHRFHHRQYLGACEKGHPYERGDERGVRYEPVSPENTM
jgi:hypothetical protein